MTIVYLLLLLLMMDIILSVMSVILKDHKTDF